MSGGTTGAGYDLPGIGWTSIFATGGVAIHSTFWHNNFGDPVSHGCVNTQPDDARWIFRWGQPIVPYDPGMIDITVTGQEFTHVQVVEGEMAAGRLTRRDALKLAALGVAGLALRPWIAQAGYDRRAAPAAWLAEFPAGERLGRVLDGKVEVKVRPDEDSPTVKEIFADEVVVWERELVGRKPLWYNQRYVETPEGYIYAPNLQIVRNQPNAPLTSLPRPEGAWMEVTVP